MAQKLFIAAILLISFTGWMVIAAAADPGGLDIANLPEMKVVNSSRGGKLLLSDSPEMVTNTGIMYQDTVEGNVRLFFYRVNATITARQLVVLLENSSESDAHVIVYKYGLGGPGFVWMAVGKAAMASYLAGGPVYQVVVPAGGSEPLSSKISDTAVLPNMLINGIFDFVADRPVTVKVMMIPLYVDVGQLVRTATVLPPDEDHLRSPTPTGGWSPLNCMIRLPMA